MRRLRHSISLAAIPLFAMVSIAAAQSIDVNPQALTLQQPPESIYAPPTPPRVEEGVNQGAIHLDLAVRYMTDYVYRGIDFSEVGGHEDSPNYQFDGKISMDLGKLPHPYVGLFINYYDADPVDKFQAFRPNLGADWLIKPLLVTAGYNSYIYPDRDALGTSEVFGRFELNDSFLFHTLKPVLSPYIYGAYDFDLYNGWYFEAGVKHDFQIEDTGITITLLADVAYIRKFQEFLASGTNDSGFQHYDLGAIGSYSLNNLLNIPKHYGELEVKGYVYYTDNLDHNLIAPSQLWGGFGIEFHY
jgi:hypothetical protein